MDVCCGQKTMLIKQRPHAQVMPASTFTLIAAAVVKALFICERRLVDTQIGTLATNLQASSRDAHREGAHSWALINKTQEIIVDNKELLELSAKAYGCVGLEYRSGSDAFYYDDPESGREEWNPLDDGAQVFSLAAKLMLKIDIRKAFVSVEPYVFNKSSTSVIEPCEDNQLSREAAVLRAIVRAAAEIQKASEGE